MAIERGAIWLIVGDSGSGKTTLCQRLITAARQQGATVQGLICPPHIQKGEKVGIEVRDIHNGEQRLLGWRSDLESTLPFTSPPIRIGEWLLDPLVLEWGNQVFRRALPCDLFVVDELGPVEFFLGKGWQAAFESLEHGLYRLALVTVRESLREAALKRWKIQQETHLTTYSTFERAREESLKILPRYLAQ